MSRTHLPWRDWRVWGRPVHPNALGVGVLMTTLTVYNAIDRGVLGATALGDVVMAGAGASLVCLVAGWVTQQQILVAVGMLAATAAYCLRGLFIALTSGPAAEGVWFSLGAVIIAGGSFYLEMRDLDEVRDDDR